MNADGRRASPTSPAVSTAVLMTLALTGFAGNSLLCRVALKNGGMDAASFTALRLASGALVLMALVGWGGRGGRRPTATGSGDWLSAWALFGYAATFSFAYVSLPTGTGALLLFGTVQASMVAGGLLHGERLLGWQRAGFLLAIAGLVWLLLPGLSAPPLLGALLMVGAGVCWCVYSLRGRARGGDPWRVTAGNFARAALPALALGGALLPWARWDTTGLVCAVASGALASGAAYAIWYAVLPRLPVTLSASLQLSVPPIAALGGIVFLGEHLTLRMVVASAAILGGIALVVLRKPQA